MKEKTDFSCRFLAKTAIDLSLTRDMNRHDGSLLTWYHDLNAVTLADHYNKTDINSQNIVY